MHRDKRGRINEKDKYNIEYKASLKQKFKGYYYRFLTPTRLSNKNKKFSLPGERKRKNERYLKTII